MKRAEVTIGGIYAAKVSGKVVPVRIDAGNPRGGWTGTNQVTGKQVRIKSAPRLRYAMAKKDGKWRRVADGTAKDATRGDTGGDGAVQGDAKAARKAKVDAWRKEVAEKVRSDPEERRKQNEKERRAKAAKDRGRKARPKAKAKRASLLDLAAEVLAETDGPMNAKTIVEKVLATGRWQTTGKTPDATLYSALIREISKKGDDSRFEKVERGTFQLAK